MRVAFFVGAFPQLSQTFVLDQVTGLLDRGHDVQVFATQPKPGAPRVPAFERYPLAARSRYWLTPFDVSRRTARLLRRAPGSTLAAMASSFGIGAPRALGVTFWPHASQVLDSPPFDVGLAHFGTHGVLAQALRDLGAMSVPLVTVFHGYDLTRIVARRGVRFYRRLFEAGELMLPVSEHFARELVKLGCPPERVQVHHMGVPTAAFTFRARALEPGRSVRLVTVCRMVEKKGLEFGLRALARVRAALGDFEWHVAGDGPLRSRFVALRDQLGLGERVVVHGDLTRDGVRSLLDTAHVFLHPSVTARDGDTEGVPVSMMEAMAAGLPVVATLHSGIPELVSDTVDGYLVPERDVAALADRLVTIAHEPERWGDMGRHGHDTVRRSFDVDRLNDTLVRILEQVRAQGPGRVPRVPEAPCGTKLVEAHPLRVRGGR
jgi:colanic acid/amylovoran biosynthesis glycosyltransferase